MHWPRLLDWSKVLSSLVRPSMAVQITADLLEVLVSNIFEKTHPSPNAEHFSRRHYVMNGPWRLGRRQGGWSIDGRKWRPTTSDGRGEGAALHAMSRKSRSVQRCLDLLFGLFCRKREVSAPGPYEDCESQHSTGRKEKTQSTTSLRQCPPLSRT